MLESSHIPDLVLPPLKTKVVGRHVHTFQCVDSTNDLALAHADHGAVFVADEQASGRGRQGNRWHSPPGTGLWFSICLNMAPRGLTFAAALAVRDAVLPRARLRVKWPNDLLCGTRKICGSLVEHRDGWSALGIGINVMQSAEDFPPELAEKAGSLYSITGMPWSRAEVLHGVLTALDVYVDRIARGNYELVRVEWARECDMVNREVCRGAVSGRVCGIDEDGALLVRTASGVQRLATGELDACATRGAQGEGNWNATRRPGA